MDDQLAEAIIKATTALDGLGNRILHEPRQEDDQFPRQVAVEVERAKEYLDRYIQNYTMRGSHRGPDDERWSPENI